MNTRFAAALGEQGRFAATCVGDFYFVPEVKAHIWKGRIASTTAELAEHVNGALKSLEEYGDPFAKLRVIEVVSAAGSATDPDVPTPESVNAALKAQNAELNQVIEKITQPGAAKATLRVLE